MFLNYTTIKKTKTKIEKILNKKQLQINTKSKNHKYILKPESYINDIFFFSLLLF